MYTKYVSKINTKNPYNQHIGKIYPKNTYWNAEDPAIGQRNACTPNL